MTELEEMEQMDLLSGIEGGESPKLEKGIEKDREEWEGAPEVEADSDPIDELEPGSEKHKKVLRYLKDRLSHSERKMAQFYPRWEVQEKKMQAYIDLPEWEKELQKMNDQGKVPQNVPITIPYTFATINTIVTYLLHTFTGRKPMFQVGSYKGETAGASRMMEQVLQFNADHTRLIKYLHSFLNATQVYNLGVLKVNWKRQEKMRTVSRRDPLTGMLSRSREKRVVFEGNEVEALDPYLFFPDPRVPMHEVNRKGEFVFWRSFEGKHQIKRLEAEGIYKWVDDAKEQMPENQYGTHGARSLVSGGDSQPGEGEMDGKERAKYMQIDQGTVEIIPEELGLGHGDVPEKWIFTILNKSQIIQAEKFDADHDMHPVCVAEPYTVGRTFGGPAIADYLSPLQDMVSWLINSHQDNVRRVLNDLIIVDPSKVEMQDLKDPGPGGIIRLKKSNYGQDVRQAIQQLPIQDVTAQHVEDADNFMRIGQQISAATDNVMGIQDQGGRKTASEVRITNEAAASRLASQARIISAQAMVDLTEMMAVNFQQYLSEEFYIQIVGEQGKREPLHVSPEHISGDFYYPIHDGTLPLDKTALFEVWQELFNTILQDQELRQQYDVGKVFEYIAELGGANNLDSMRVTQVQSPEALQQQAEQGQAMPMDEFAQQEGMDPQMMDQMAQMAGGGMPMPETGGGPQAGGPAQGGGDYGLDQMISGQ